MSAPFTSAGRFEMSRVLSRLFGVLGRNFGPFLLSAVLLAGLPMLALGFLQMGMLGAQGGIDNAESIGLTLLLITPVSLISSAVLQATIIHGSVADLNGRKASVTEGLATAFGKILPLIGLSLVVGIATGLGFLLLIVPGILVALAFSVAVPALLVERLGVFEAIQRSRDLTRNHRGAIFGLFVLYAVAYFMVQLVGGVAAGIAGAAGMRNFMAVNYLVAAPLVQVLSSLLLAVGTASIYHELRTIKEGVGPEALARVFD